MKKTGTMVAFIVINFIFQTSLYNFINIFGVIPNISLILVVIFAMMTDGIIGGVLGLLTGALYDVMLHDIFGMYTLIFFVIGALIGIFSEYTNKENYMLYIVSTLAATVFMHFATFAILFFLKYRVADSFSIWGSILLETIFNMIISALILKIVLITFNKLNIK